MRRIFLSDLHLQHADTTVFSAFVNLLQHESQHANEIYLLGDLVEMWVGDDDDSPLASALRTTLKNASAQAAIYFQHGNRDFLVGEAFAKETGITILPDPYTLEINNQKVILSHGDFLCTDDKDYIDFRNQVRNQDWQNNFLKKALNERKQIAATLRADSKEATSKKSNEITDVNNQSVEDFINEHQPDLFIHGHTHRPNIHDVGSSKRIVLGDWGEYGWLLTIDGQTFNLEKFSIA